MTKRRLPRIMKRSALRRAMTPRCYDALVAAMRRLRKTSARNLLEDERRHERFTGLAHARAARGVSCEEISGSTMSPSMDGSASNDEKIRRLLEGVDFKPFVPLAM